MRIKGSQQSDSQRFWPSTVEWLRSRRGLAQFLFAFCVGLALALALGVTYKLGAWKIIEPPIRALLAEAEDTADIVLVTNDLPNLYFDIGFEEFQTMVAQRDEALQRGILLLDDADWMRAEIRYQAQTIPVRIRLKGDWVDHLEEKKWSFRVQTRNDAALMGMRSFSVQSPRTRRFLLEWLYLEDLRRADILAPRYSFVNVFVNGEDWGVYALEENFSKELLESQGRREGIILRFDETLFWERRALYGGQEDNWKYGVDPIAVTFNSQAFAEVDEFDTNRILSDPVLMEQRAAAFGLLRGFQNQVLSPSEAFDANLMGRYLAHTNLWGGYHSLIWINERYYYNPLTALLEPIGYDALPLVPTFAHHIDLEQYDDLSIMKAYVQEVLRISQPGYLEELKSEYDADYARYRTALIEEFDPRAIQSPWELLAERQDLLVAALNPPQTVYAYVAGSEADSTTEVQIGNILRYPVVIQEIRIGEQSAPIRIEWLAESDHRLIHQEAKPSVVLRRSPGAVPRYVTLRIPNTVIDTLLPADTSLYSNTLQIVTHLYGVEPHVVVDAKWDYPPIASASKLPAQPSLEEALAQHPFLTLSEQSGFLELKPGDWQVEGDLILPSDYGLWASEPVTLAFDREAILFSRGPLIMQGPTPGSISLKPQDAYWAGVFVLQAGQQRPSILHNVEIRATAGISRDGWITTGGVTFYESPIELSSSRLLDSSAEDAINVVRAEFEFLDTEFGNAASDAFDGDFTQGTIEHCAFHDVRGDGIDVSGSDIIVDDVSLLRVRDKGISAGEGSTVTSRKVYASDVGIAIASKDTSRVTLEEARIDRAWIAPFAAYVKKMEYGPASLQASHVEIVDGSRQALVQTGSIVVIDGKEAATIDLDVPALYSQLEALGQMHLRNYQLGSGIRLVGYELLTPEPDLEGNLRLVLYWQADTVQEVDYTVFVHVVNSSGDIVAQKDNMPRDDLSPTTQWEVGELIVDLHVLPIPLNMPAGEYQVIIGMYNWQTGQRIPVHTPSGQEIASGAIVLEQTFVVSN